MNEEAFNLSIRKFLKEFGVTAQREIERAVAEAVRTGRLKGDEVLNARASLRLESLGVDHAIDGRITLS
jgi:hypothetical protein